jgi:hypothetical protein
MSGQNRSYSIGSTSQLRSIFSRDSLVSGNFGVSFLTLDLLSRARMDLLC